MLCVSLRVGCQAVVPRVCSVVIPTAHSSTYHDPASEVSPPRQAPEQHELFKDWSSFALCRELWFLKAMDFSVHSSIVQRRVLPVLTREPSCRFDRLVQQVLRRGAAPVIQYFCLPSIEAVVRQTQQCPGPERVATHLSEHVATTEEGNKNRAALQVDVRANHNGMAVKPSAICPQHILELGDVTHPEVLAMFDDYTNVCDQASLEGKRFFVDAEGRLTKTVGDALVHHLYRNGCEFTATIQASYTDAHETLDRYIAWSRLFGVPFNVKFVKGAYVKGDQLNPSTCDMTSGSFKDTHEMYLSLMRHAEDLGLVDSTIIASHNPEILDLAHDKGFETGNLAGLEVRRTTVVIVPYGPLKEALHWTLRRLDSGVDGLLKRLQAIKDELKQRHGFFAWLWSS